MGNVSEAVRVKAQHCLHQAVLTLLNDEYPFVAGSKVQNMFADDIVSLVNDQYRQVEKLDPGQARWSAAAIGDKPHYGQTATNTRYVPVTLTIVSRDDIDMRAAGRSNREVRERRIVRLFTEAFEQGGVLTQSDVAELLTVSTSTVGKQVIEHMEREGRIVPTRGIVHDMGRSTTHKRIIVRLHLDGYQTPEISRRTDHVIESCDRYIKDYKRVRLLARKGMDPAEIGRTLEMSRGLVREYLEIHEEYETGGAKE